MPSASTTAPSRAVYTDPEVPSIGLTLEQAPEAGDDAFGEVADLATTARATSRKPTAT